MGNIEVLSRGDIQLTSAGTGISHSEKAHGGSPVHFLQIWSLPNASRLQPKYYSRHFSDDEKRKEWVKAVAPVGEAGVKDERATEVGGPTPVHSPLRLWVRMIGEGEEGAVGLEGKKAYVHVVQTSGYNPLQGSGAAVRISGAGEEGGVVLKEGDGAYAIVDAGGAELKVENVGDRVAEVLVFDLEI